REMYSKRRVRSFEAEPIRQEFRNVCLLPAFIFSKKHNCIRTEFVNHLTASATGRTIRILIIHNRNRANLQLGAALRDGCEYRSSLGAVCHSIRSILDIATEENIALGGQQSRPDPEL